MGMEFEVNNLEDMCAAMRDNRIPVKLHDIELTEDMNFGQVLRMIREQKGMNQTEMSEIFYCNFQSVSRWERNLTSPPIELAREMLQKLGYQIVIRKEKHKNGI